MVVSACARTGQSLIEIKKIKTIHSRVEERKREYTRRSTTALFWYVLAEG